MPGLLRSDGLYVSGQMRLDDGLAYREYLRFYADGAVVIASVSDPSTAAMVAQWLSPESHGHPSGRYSIEGEKLRFTAIIPESLDYRDGTVEPEVRFEYEGLILPDLLRITYHAPDPARSREDQYRFCPVP